MPIRRSRVDALDVVSYEDGVVRLDLRVSSGTYVRAIADALGGHCATLRRTEVGPFASRRPTRSGSSRRTRRSRGSDPGAIVKVARSPGELERRPRAVAIGTFDGVHLGHRARARGSRGRGPPRDRRHLRAASAHRVRVRGRAADDAGAAPRADRRGGDRRGARGRVRPRVLAARARGVRGAGPARRSEPRSWSPGRTSASARAARATWRLLRGLGIDARAVPLVEGVSSSRIRDLAARRRDRARGQAARPAAGGRRARSSRATRAAARSGSRPRTCASIRACSCRRTGSTRARRSTTARRSRSARTRTTAAPSGASRPTCSTSRATSTGERLVVQLWRRLRDEAQFESEEELVAQIARDVEETRAAEPPGLPSARAAPLRRGSPAQPVRVTALTPPK